MPGGSKVLDVLPYTGVFKQCFDCVLVMQNVRSRSGRTEIAWNSQGHDHDYVSKANPAKAKSGGFSPKDNWSVHTDYPVADWAHEVGGDITRLGYIDWVNHQIVVAEETEQTDHET